MDYKAVCSYFLLLVMTSLLSASGYQKNKNHVLNKVILRAIVTGLKHRTSPSLVPEYLLKVISILPLCKIIVWVSNDMYFSQLIKHSEIINHKKS